MRKLVLAAVALLGFTLSTQAQEVKKAVQKTEKAAQEAKKDVKKAADKVAADSKVVLKKDGTPDKRYKQAKDVVLKKDGTPDKRYKQNK